MNYHLERFGKLTFQMLAHRQSFLKFILQFNLHSFQTAFFVVTCMHITSSKLVVFCCFGHNYRNQGPAYAAFVIQRYYEIGGPVLCSLAPLENSVLFCFFSIIVVVVCLFFLFVV